MTTPREDAIAAGPDAREAFIRRIVALTPGNFTDDFLFLLDRLDEARAAHRVEPAPTLDVGRLARAMDLVDVAIESEPDDEADHAEHLAYARDIAREYAALAPADPTADLRTALPGHPSPDRGSGPWVLRLVCCGYDDGIERYATWDEADMFRQTYVTGPGGHDRAAILTRDVDRSGA